MHLWHFMYLYALIKKIYINYIIAFANIYNPLSSKHYENSL